MKDVCGFVKATHRMLLLTAFLMVFFTLKGSERAADLSVFEKRRLGKCLQRNHHIGDGGHL